MAYQDDIHPVHEKWYAVITGPRHEKHVISRLGEKGIKAWALIIKKIRRYKTMTRVVFSPLISRYIFVHIARNQYVDILKERLVLSFLYNKGRIYAVEDEEILVLRRVSGEDVEVRTTSDVLEKGDKIEIIYGDLTGLKEEIVKFKGKNYFAIAIETLGMHMLIDVPKGTVRKIKLITY